MSRRLPPNRSRPRPTRRTVPRKTMRIRKLAGQSPMTTAERLAGGFGRVARLANTVSQLAGLINSEAKNVDISLAGTADNTGSYLVTANAIAEGDDINQRNGRVILSKSVDFKATVMSPVAQTNPVSIGWALIMDKKASIGLSAIPWTDVFLNASPNSPININDSDRFVILARGNFTTSPGGQQARAFKKFINLKGIHIKYNGTTSTSFDQNRIFLTMISSVGTNAPTVEGYMRYRYYDN